jgi:hypothetical protein
MTDSTETTAFREKAHILCALAALVAKKDAVRFPGHITNIESCKRQRVLFGWVCALASCERGYNVLATASFLRHARTNRYL